MNAPPPPNPPDEFEQDADDLILHVAEPLRAAPAVPVRQQQLLGLGAPLHQRRLQVLGDRVAHLPVAAGMQRGELLQLGRDRGRVEQIARFRRALFGGRKHGVTG